MTREANRSPTIKEVATYAGVALSSVSRVLNEHPDVSERMRSRVLGAVAELGYEPDLLASSLRRGNTRTVGIVVADIVNPLFATILKGAERRLRQAGYSIVLVHSEGERGRDVEGARLLRRRRVDGLILSLTDEERPETLEELHQLDIPVVLLDRRIDDGLNFSAVLADHRTGLRRATEHLIALGHRDIRLVTGPKSTRPARERAAGLAEGFSRRGLLLPDGSVTHGPFSVEFGNRVIEELLRAGDRPSAIIAGGNLTFVGIIAALHRHGLRVGQDIALITCDDIPLAEFHSPPITVVARDTDAMGAIAADLLLERLIDGAPARTETIPTELLVRESTHPVR